MDETPATGPPESDEEYYARAREQCLTVIHKNQWSLSLKHGWSEEDLVQEVMDQLLSQGEPPRNLEAWLNTVVTNQGIDQSRAEHNKQHKTEIEESRNREPATDPPETDEQYYARARKTAHKVANRRLWSFGSSFAEDAVQEAMVRLISQDERPRNLEAWLSRVIRNFAVDAWRARQGRPIETGFGEADAWLALRQAFSDPSASQAAIAPSSWKALVDYLRDTFSMRELQLARLVSQGHSDAQIADLMGYASANSVKTIKSRIRKRAQELDYVAIAELLNHPHVYQRTSKSSRSRRG